MIFDPPPRSRRRVVARFLWPALVVGAILVAVVVSSAGEETRTELDYMNQMRSQATQLARGGSAISDVMARITEVDREEFTTVFDSVDQDLQEARVFVADEPPTQGLIPVWALYRQAIEAWTIGAKGLYSAVLLAADDPSDITAVNATGDALAELRSGDLVYEDLQSEFERQEIPDPVSPMMNVRMSPTDSDLFSQSKTYVASARQSNNGLGLRPGLAVSQVVADPPWETNVEDKAVVPATDTIVFSTVITNSGNIASEPESVKMTLEGGAEPVVAESELPPLRPDQQVTIEFPQQDVLPDTPYTVKIELELTNPDSDMTDNKVTVDFTVNAP